MFRPFVFGRDMVLADGLGANLLVEHDGESDFDFGIGIPRQAGIGAVEHLASAAHGALPLGPVVVGDIRVDAGFRVEQKRLEEHFLERLGDPSAAGQEHEGFSVPLREELTGGVDVLGEGIQGTGTGRRTVLEIGAGVDGEDHEGQEQQGGKFVVLHRRLLFV